MCTGRVKRRKFGNRFDTKNLISKADSTSLDFKVMVVG
jgi:hypothetical protein